MVRARLDWVLKSALLRRTLLFLLLLGSLYGLGFLLPRHIKLAREPVNTTSAELVSLVSELRIISGQISQLTYDDPQISQNLQELHGSLSDTTSNLQTRASDLSDIPAEDRPLTKQHLDTLTNMASESSNRFLQIEKLLIYSPSQDLEVTTESIDTGELLGRTIATIKGSSDSFNGRSSVDTLVVGEGALEFARPQLDKTLSCLRELEELLKNKPTREQVTARKHICTGEYTELRQELVQYVLEPLSQEKIEAAQSFMIAL